jgi:hypothetical protein
MKFEEQYKVYQSQVEKKLPEYIHAANNSGSLMKSMEYSLMLGGKTNSPCTGDGDVRTPWDTQPVRFFQPPARWK